MIIDGGVDMKNHDNMGDLYFVRLSSLISMLLKGSVFATIAITIIAVIFLFVDRSAVSLAMFFSVVIKGVIALISEIIVSYLIQVFCELVMYLHNISESLEEMNSRVDSSNQFHSVSSDDDSFEARVNSYEENQ